MIVILRSSDVLVTLAGTEGGSPLCEYTRISVAFTRTQHVFVRPSNVTVPFILLLGKPSPFSVDQVFCLSPFPWVER